MRANGVRRDKRLLAGVLAVALALVLGILAGNFQMVVHAATGTIAADSVRVRKDASTSSEMVGSLTRGVTVTVNAVKDGTDGHKWYQIESEGISGYVRDDLITVTGEVGGDTGTGTGTDTPPAAPTVTVTPVQPLNATVTGGQVVRVRSDADANANNIIAQLAQGTAVTVTGQAISADGTTWYQVTYDDNGTPGQGFIRSEYVDLGGATVVPQDQSPAPETPPEEDQPPADETQNDGASSEQNYVIWTTDRNGENEGWWFLDREKNSQYPIDKVLTMVRNYNTVLEKANAASTQKVVIIVMAVVIVVLIIVGTMLFFKMKDMSDQAYFSAVEKQTIRERNEIRKERGRDEQSTAPRRTVSAGGEGSKSGASGRTVTPGASRPQSAGGQRPVNGQRPASGQRPVSGQARPVGQGPVGQSSGAANRPASGQTAGGQRPVGSQPRTVGQSSGTAGRPVSGQSRTMGQPVAGQRPAGTQVRPGGQTSEGTGRPAGSQVRSAGGGQMGQTVRQDRPVRPGSSPQSSGEASRPQTRPSAPASNQRPAAESRPKTAAPVEEDDDFEFEYLNWDGEENS